MLTMKTKIKRVMGFADFESSWRESLREGEERERERKACTLFVYGIDRNMSNGDIQSEFEKYGAMTNVYNTGKGYAFVTFSRMDEAYQATQV